MGRRVAIVTGAARGIGFACAQTLANADLRVVIADIDEERGVDAVGAHSNEGHEFVALDFRDVSAIDPMVDAVHRRFSRIDVLVNNAGVTRAIDMFDVDEDVWDLIAEVNLRGTFFIFHSAARRMRWGASIINVALIAGKGWKRASNIAYASSDGGIVTMTRIASARLGAEGIRVNAVCPGLTKTELMLDRLNGRAEYEQTTVDALLTDVSRQVPLGVINAPSDVAATVLFLATYASRTITGQSINADGEIVFD